MKRGMIALVVLALVGGLWLHGQDQPRSAKTILGELKKCVQALEKDRSSIDDQKKMEARVQVHVKSASALLQEFEKNHPKSSLLAEARSEALKVLDQVTEGEVVQTAVQTAKGLKESAGKGSDFAAQADLVLLHAYISGLLKDVESNEELKSVWSKNADELHNKIEEYVKSYPKYSPALDHLAELASLAGTADVPRTRRMILEAVARSFPDHALAKELKREEAVGKDFALDFLPINGKKALEVKDLKGKVVLIDFWATWCGPCKKEMPNLKKLYDKHAKDGLEIIGVSLDDDEKPAADYVKDNTIDWPQLIGKKAADLADKWGVEEIPVFFVIDRKGKLRSVDARGKLDKLIPELLAEK